jgi:hypothetical protein
MIKFVPILGCDFQLFAHPSWLPFFVLGVEVAFVVGDVLWHCMHVSIAAVFGAVFAAHEIVLAFLVCLPPTAL